MTAITTPHPATLMFSLRKRLREVKCLSRVWFFVKKFRSYKPSVQVKHVKILERGNYANRFAFVPGLLRENPIIYSFGIGWDVSFDLALIHEFGAEIFAFDPTPSSLEWAQENVSESKFHIFPWGLSDIDGTEKFYTSGGCGSIAPGKQTENFIEVPVKRLHTIMNEMEHDYIDLLKMDIEGAEFAVLPDILKSGAKFGQLCVEVHNRFYDDGDSRIKELISLLNGAGYYIASVSPNYEELTFIKH